MCHAGMERKRGLGVGRDICALTINQYTGGLPELAASYGALEQVIQSDLVNQLLNSVVRTESVPAAVQLTLPTGIWVLTLTNH